MNVGGFFHKHLSGKSDWSASDSLVNRTRRAGLSKPLVGAGIGAAVGGTTGFLAGAYNLSKDEVTIGTETRQLTRPELIGADYDSSHTYATYTTDADGNMQTHWHTDPADWDPIIANRPTGQTASKQVFQHSSSFGPLTGALVGLGAGAVVGALVTSLTRLVEDPLPSYYQKPKVPETEKDRRVAVLADKAPLVGTLAGAALGATAGAVAGHLAAEKNVVLDQIISEPVYTHRTIGYIPRVSQKSSIPRELFHTGQKIYYNELPDERWGSPHFSDRGQAVNRSYFTGEYEQVHSVENSHWLTPTRGALVGAGVGALTGLATGVAGGILMKIAAGEQAPRSAPY